MLPRLKGTSMMKNNWDFSGMIDEIALFNAHRESDIYDAISNT